MAAGYRQRAWLSALAALAIMISGAPADAGARSSKSTKPTVCVFKFKGPSAPALRLGVINLLKKKAKLFARERFLKVAAKKRVRATSIGIPRAFSKVARAAKVDFILKGSTKRTRKGTLLTLQAFDQSGSKVWSAILRVRGRSLGKTAGKIRATLLPALLDAEAPSTGVALASAAPAAPAAAASTAAGPSLEESLPPGSGGSLEMFDSPAKLPPPPDASWFAGSSIDLSDVITGDIPKEKKSRGHVVTATVGAAHMMHSHRALFGGGNNCIGPRCIDSTGEALTVAMDLHPLGWVDSPVAGAFGIGVRYTHELATSLSGSYDEAAGGFAAEGAPYYRDLATDLHGEIKLGKHRHLPTVEPMIGFGLLDLPLDVNSFGARSLLHNHLYAGLRIAQPIVPKILTVAVAGEYKMGVGVGADAREALGAVSFPSAKGYGFSIDATVHPVRWMEIRAGWSYKHMSADFGGSEHTNYAPVTTSDGTHGVHLMAGIRVP